MILAELVWQFSIAVGRRDEGGPVGDDENFQAGNED